METKQIKQIIEEEINKYRAYERHAIEEKNEDDLEKYQQRKIALINLLTRF